MKNWWEGENDDEPYRADTSMQYLPRHRSPWLHRCNRKRWDHSGGGDEDEDRQNEMVCNHGVRLNHEDADDDDHAKMR